MKTIKLKKVAYRALAVGCVMLTLVATSGVAFGVTLLTDSFNDGLDLPIPDYEHNINVNIANRQTGTLAPSTWSSNEAEYWQLVLKESDGSEAPTALGDDALLVYGTGSPVWKAAWNDYNFAAQANQVIAYEIDASVMLAKQLAGIVIGPAGNQFGTDGSVAVTLDPSGNYAIYDGAAQVGAGSITPASWTTVSISLDDTGIGTTMDVSIAGSSVLSSHAVGTALTDRYYMLGDGDGDAAKHLAFNNLNVTAISAGQPGDFDNDGDVDGADFVAWQTHFPTASGATLADGDADGDGDVDGADFVVWQTNFPTTPGTAISSIPEPTSLILISCAAAGTSLSLRRYAAVRFLMSYRSTKSAG